MGDIGTVASSGSKTSPAHQSANAETGKNEEEDGGSGDLLGPNFGKIVELYTTVWSKLILPEGIGGLVLNELTKDLCALREFFACAVCNKLVPQEFIFTSIPAETCASPHLVCKTCEEKEWTTPCALHAPLSRGLERNGHDYLKQIVDSYKGFCALAIQTPELRIMLEEKTESDPTFEAMPLVDLLTEGALASMTSTTGTNDQLYETVNEELEIDRVKSEGEEAESLSEINIEDNDSPVDLDQTPSSPVKLTRIVPNYYTDLNAQMPGSFLKQENLVQVVHQNTNWPDVNHVIQYASGNMAFSNPSAVYNLPLQMSLASSAPQTRVTPAPGPTGIVGTVVRAVAGTEQELKVRLPKEATQSFDLTKKRSTLSRKGCRCGNAAAVPGKLTCCGQRCPCYVERILCVGCRCKGCRNPHQADGKKLLILPRDRQSETASTEGDTFVPSVSMSNTNTLTFQRIPEVPQATYTSVYPLNPMTSYTAFPIPVQVPISIVGLSSLLQTNSAFSGINKY